MEVDDKGNINQLGSPILASATLNQARAKSISTRPRSSVADRSRRNTQDELLSGRSPSHLENSEQRKRHSRVHAPGSAKKQKLTKVPFGLEEGPAEFQRQASRLNFPSEHGPHALSNQIPDVEMLDGRAAPTQRGRVPMAAPVTDEGSHRTSHVKTNHQSPSNAHYVTTQAQSLPGHAPIAVSTTGQAPATIPESMLPRVYYNMILPQEKVVVEREMQLRGLTYPNWPFPRFARIHAKIGHQETLLKYCRAELHQIENIEKLELLERSRKAKDSRVVRSRSNFFDAALEFQKRRLQRDRTEHTILNRQPKDYRNQELAIPKSLEEDDFVHMFSDNGVELSHQLLDNVEVYNDSSKDLDVSD